MLVCSPYEPRTTVRILRILSRNTLLEYILIKKRLVLHMILSRNLSQGQSKLAQKLKPDKKPDKLSHVVPLLFLHTNPYRASRSNLIRRGGVPFSPGVLSGSQNQYTPFWEKQIKWETRKFSENYIRGSDHVERKYLFYESILDVPKILE